MSTGGLSFVSSFAQKQYMKHLFGAIILNCEWACDTVRNAFVKAQITYKMQV